MNRGKWYVSAILGGLALMIAVGASAQDRDEVLKKRAALMKKLEGTIRQKLNVPPSDGMFLKIMAEGTRAKRVLEIGSSNGYSALWMGQALEKTGGHLWTIEIDAGRAKECRENVKGAGLDKVVTSIEGDALQEIPKLEGPFDMVFIDAWKKDYKRYLDLVKDKVPAGGVIVAHNTIRSANDMGDYLDAVNNSPEFDSVTLSTTMQDGFTISYKNDVGKKDLRAPRKMNRGRLQRAN